MGFDKIIKSNLLLQLPPTCMIAVYWRILKGYAITRPQVAARPAGSSVRCNMLNVYSPRHYYQQWAQQLLATRLATRSPPAGLAIAPAP